MADPLKSAASEAIPTTSQPAPVARPRPDPYVPRHRFGVAYLGLAAVVGALIGLAVVLSTAGKHHHAVVRWSAWQPTSSPTVGVGSGTLEARRIAEHVSSQYGLAGGRQFVAVTADPMEIPTTTGPVPVSALVISSGHAGVTQEKITIAYPQAGVFYQMCGEGTACLPAGNGSGREDGLLARESVELALYTFHYLPQADHVVVFLPPQRGVSQQDPRFRRAIYLTRRELSTELSTPLAASIPPSKTPLTPDTLSAGEANTFEGLTVDRLFHYDFQQAANNSVLLLFSPPTS